VVDGNVEWTRVRAWLTKPFIGCCFPAPDAVAADPDAQDAERSAEDVVARPEADPERMVPPPAPALSAANVVTGGLGQPAVDPDAKADDTAALREAWHLLQDELPDDCGDAAMQSLQRVRSGNYMDIAKAIIACCEPDEFVATPDDQPPGEERIAGEGGPKEFAVRQKHMAERVRQMVQHDTEASIYGGEYFSKAQQDEWTARTIRTGDRNLLCNKSGEIIHSPVDTLNFVPMEDADYRERNGERLILCPEKTATGAKYSTHCQLAHGRPVKYAGEMRLNFDVIAEYNLKAGHYWQPMARNARKFRDHQFQIARLETLIESGSAADTAADEEYRNGEEY
jgi:hypothetical protein